MPVSYTAIGRNIRTARKKKQLTQAQTAELLGMSTLHYGRLERGNRSISLEQLAAIADILDISIFDLLNGMADNAVLTPPQVRNRGIGTIVDFLSAGCSDDAQALMLDVCTLIAKHDKCL